MSVATAPAPRRALPGRLVWVVGAAVAGILLVLDQATKVLAVANLEHQQPVDLGVVSLTVLRNPNAAFGIPGFTGMFVIVTVLVLGLVARLLSRTDRLWLATGYGLVAGGALGNGVDRVLRDPGFPDGAVVDFVDLGWFPVFNVADAGITCGAAIVIAVLVLAGQADGEAPAPDEPSVRPEPVSPRR